MVVTCPPLDGLERISEDMPFRMPSRRFLDVAAVCHVPKLTECGAYRLGFFTGYQNFHSVALPPHSAHSMLQLSAPLTSRSTIAMFSLPQ